jgi:low affinity Fe/Cu permease
MNLSFDALFIVRLAIGHCRQAAFYIFIVLVLVTVGNMCGLDWSYPVTSVSDHYKLPYVLTVTLVFFVCVLALLFNIAWKTAVCILLEDYPVLGCDIV